MRVHDLAGAPDVSRYFCGRPEEVGNVSWNAPGEVSVGDVLLAGDAAYEVADVRREPGWHGVKFSARRAAPETPAGGDDGSRAAPRHRGSGRGVDP